MAVYESCGGSDSQQTWEDLSRIAIVRHRQKDLLHHLPPDGNSSSAASADSFELRAVKDRSNHSPRSKRQAKRRPYYIRPIGASCTTDIDVHVRPVHPAPRPAKKTSEAQDPWTEDGKAQERELEKESASKILIDRTKKKYPNLHKRKIVVPSVHFNRVTFSEVEIADVGVKTLQPSHRESDARFDECHRRFRIFLDKLPSDEPTAVCFSLCFDNILNAGGNKQRRSGKKSDSSQDRKSGRNSQNQAQPRQKGHTPRQQQHGTLTNGRSHLTTQEDRQCSSSQEDISSSSQEISPSSAFSSSSSSSKRSLDSLDLSVFPRPREKMSRGEFDVLIVHRTHGFVLCEIKSIGDSFSQIGRGPADSWGLICKKLYTSLRQLERNEEMLRYLLSDLPLGDVPVNKALVLPNMKRDLVRDVVLREPELMQSFCKTFNSSTLEDALNKCVFSEQIPPTGYAETPENGVTEKLFRDWWTNLTSPSCVHSAMNDNLYETIVARFCGPATKQFVTTAKSRRAEVSTLADGVQETARCFTSLVLTPEQVDLLSHAEPSPRVFLQGPPGSGKSQLLMLKALQWLRQGQDVLIISAWISSHALAYHIHHQITEQVTRKMARRLNLVLERTGHLEDIIQALLTLRLAGSTSETLDSGVVTDMVTDFPGGDTGDLLNGRGGEGGGGDSIQFDSDDVEEAEKEEMDVASSKLHVLVPEAPWFLDKLLLVLETLLGREGFVLWVSSSSPSLSPPSSFQSLPLPNFVVLDMTHNLRRPPVVVREMMASPAYAAFRRPGYTSQDGGALSQLPHPTDGPRVKRMQHHDSHGVREVVDCEQCGETLGLFLTQDLNMGRTTGEEEDDDEEEEATTNTTPSGEREDRLAFRDVLISGYLPDLKTQSHVVEVFQDPPSDPLEMDLSPPTPISSSEPHPSPLHERGFFRGLQGIRVPYDVIDKDDVSSYRKLAVPETEVRGGGSVQVAPAELVKGLERKVVVMLGAGSFPDSVPRYVDPAYDVMGCCTSQLVIVGDPGDSLIERLDQLRVSHRP